jgi:A/G-specific adenine glycosylase
VAELSTRKRGIARALGAWYDRVERDLPWRRTRDPYAIWVSEIMLQQTRVDTVVPYYQRFLERFPTVRALAEAPLEEVLRQWSGLGYYRRARQLHLAAAEVVERYGGELPERGDELRRLSGIGRYTAGAIASIAFDAPEPVVDGNVLRVMSRLFGLEEDMRRARGQARVWQLAGELLPRDRPGRFNQALMELGATLCTPRKPACSGCPLSRGCRAHASGSAESLPRLGERRAPLPRSLFAAVVVHRPSGRLLMARRQPDGLFGGLWEPPMAKERAGLSKHGVVAPLVEVGSVTHVLSHRKLQVVVVSAVVARASRLPAATVAPYDALAWRRLEEAPLSSLARKILRCAGEGT